MWYLFDSYALLLCRTLLLVITRQYYATLWLRSNVRLEFARIHYSADTRLSASSSPPLPTGEPGYEATLHSYFSQRRNSGTNRGSSGAINAGINCIPSAQVLSDDYTSRAAKLGKGSGYARLPYYHLRHLHKQVHMKYGTKCCRRGHQTLPLYFLRGGCG